MFNAGLWEVVLTLHVMGIIIWVGGCGFVVMVSRPSVQALEAVQRHNVLLAAFTRLFRILWPVMIMTLVTGWLLALRLGGLGALDWNLNAMQAIALLMAAITISAYFGPFRVARRALRAKAETIRSVHARLAVVAILGVVAIILGIMNNGV